MTEYFVTVTSHELVLVDSESPSEAAEEAEEASEFDDATAIKCVKREK